MAKHNISIAVLILISIILLGKSCFGQPAEYDTTPWLVEIRKNSLHSDNQTGVTHHCTGVIHQSNKILTSRACIDLLPMNTQLIIYAGRNNWRDTGVQIFQTTGVNLSSESRIASITVSPSVVGTSTVGIMSHCHSDCSIPQFGYQFGWNNASHTQYRLSLEVIQFDFSDSIHWCNKLQEDSSKKLCALIVESEHCDMNLGGEALMKVHLGQSILVGLWEYDDCYQNIRVFDKVCSSDFC